ncbi:MAG: hypothetical protein V5A68_08390, partial [Candidatus Thermoplasmatota archaeon]
YYQKKIVCLPKDFFFFRIDFYGTSIFVKKITMNLKKTLIYLIISLLFFSVLIQSGIAEENVKLDFFYSETCDSCEDDKKLIEDNFAKNSSYSYLEVVIKDVNNKTYYQQWVKEYDSLVFPFVVIKSNNLSTQPILENKITVKNIKNQIERIYFLSILNSSFEKEDVIYVSYYYSSDLNKSFEHLTKLSNLEKNESLDDKLKILKKDVYSNETYLQEYYNLENISDGDLDPVFLIEDKNEGIVFKTKDNKISRHLQLLEDYLSDNIDSSKDGQNQKKIIDTPFGSFDISDLSLPLLTILIGGVDSVNPCAIFILFILLGLLVYAESRRRILLIGGIFIFFSGLWYFIFMFILATTFSRLEIWIIAGFVGILSIIFGILNIKDFFFFKKGISIGIPEEKKPGIYKQMRKIVKAKKLSTAVIGTIFLAATVNLFEFLCSLQWAGFYTGQLQIYNISVFQQYLYIFFYNIIYILPLVVIVLIFAFTLGRWKLSEWQGRILRLFSGIMILSFGIIFLYDYSILEDVVTPFILLIFSLIITAIISITCKKLDFCKSD